MPQITDQQFEALKASLNSAIHELVFAVKHLEEDQLEEASSSLMTAQGTIDTVAQQVVEAGG